VPNELIDIVTPATRRVVRFGAIYAVVVAAGLFTGTVTGIAGVICLAGLLISTLVWIVTARGLTAVGPGAAGYGGVLVWFLLTVPAYVVPWQLPAPAVAAMRIVGVAVLLAGVLSARSRLRREAARDDLATELELVTGAAARWDPKIQRDMDRRRGGTSPYWS
jgi:hypothetical protein